MTFSWRRLWAVLIKEFIQMKRDRATLGMMVGIPCIQLILFGFAVNSDPKNLPTAIISADNSPITRHFIAAVQNTSYFKIEKILNSEEEGDRLLKEGSAQFVIHIPANFTHDFVRNHHPAILLEADATDPAATGYAVLAIQTLMPTVFNIHSVGILHELKNIPPPVNLIFHANYNPERITQFNIVPGLLGVVLTMTLVIITSLAITRESERGTMENLLATPARPVEVMLGKLAPYLMVGYVQVILILLAAYFVFEVPMQGHLILLFILCLPFIAANLAVGLTFSTLAKSQLQAVQFSMFFFLPSLLLSGFVFPFRAMPLWAQWLGNVLPITHFLVIVHGILLKGNGIIVLWPALWPILIFMVVVLWISIKRYRRTLD